MKMKRVDPLAVERRLEGRRGAKGSRSNISPPWPPWMRGGSLGEGTGWVCCLQEGSSTILVPWDLGMEEGRRAGSRAPARDGRSVCAGEGNTKAGGMMEFGRRGTSILVCPGGAGPDEGLLLIKTSMGR